MRTRMVALAAAILLAAACGAEPGDGPTTTTGPGETTTTGEETGNGDGVSSASTSLGEVLVDPDGMTMYIFTEDVDGESVCYDDCEAAWPPVPGDVDISSDLDGALFGTTTRDDGSSQLTVNNQPLYLWVADSSPGDVTGQDVEGVWFVVDTNGEKIGASGDDAGSEDSGGYDGGY